MTFVTNNLIEGMIPPNLKASVQVVTNFKMLPLNSFTENVCLYWAGDERNIKNYLLANKFNIVNSVSGPRVGDRLVYIIENQNKMVVFYF